MTRNYQTPKFIQSIFSFKAKSERILSQILANIDRKGVFLNKLRSLEVGKMAQIEGKIGRVTLINVVEKRILVWLEIALPWHRTLSGGVRGPVTVHYGLEIFAK